ncbi:hypothetical protein ABFX02_04G043800 [Erythranthe guttata]
MFFNTATEELDSYYPIRPECQADAPMTRFKARVGKTLSPRRWNAAFTQDGHLDIAGVLRRIQRGGIHPTIKGAVWEFLLGCFDPNSTTDERNEVRERRREQYAAWKAVCQNMVPAVGSGKFITTPIVTDDGHPVEENNGAVSNGGPMDQREFQWKLVLSQIGLDVVRTDRTLVYYEDEANQAKLWDILAVYAWVDKDIGYVQGMNDICSPMVILLEHEADAFWCFERAMRRLRENFRCTTSSMGVQSQLGTLSQIIKAIDPKLHQHLEELDGGEYLFAIRMLMVLFRREFSLVDAMYLWEVMWAMEYNPNTYALYEESREGSTSNGEANKMNNKLLKQYGKFERKNVQTGVADQRSALAVFLVASVLEKKNKQLLREAQGMDDVVQILGEITGNLDAKKALKEALKIHKKYLSKAKKPIQFPQIQPSQSIFSVKQEMEGTIFAPALEGMKHVKSEDGVMLTKPFLDVCKLIIPVIEKFGAAMALVKSDIGGNVTRLETKYLSNPTKYDHLYSMVQEEVDAKTAKGSSSCTNGLLWLTRAMDFLVELFRNLLQHQDWAMSQACTDSYTKTLKQWHGWLASSSFTVAMKLAPDRKKFLDVVAGSGDINSDIEKFCSSFSPFLEENHKFLASVGMDALKAS